MLGWFKVMEWYEQLLWALSAVSTVLFLSLMLRTFIKKEPDKKRLRLFSRFFDIKNIMAFLAMFGWTAITGIYQNLSFSVSIAFGVFSGLMMMAITSALFFFTQKLKESRI